MKVLWLCNIALPAVARQLGMEGSNKEGWVSGMAAALLAHQRESGIELAVASPLPGGAFSSGEAVCRGRASMDLKGGEEASFSFYGFREDVGHPERYDESLEAALREILSLAEPDIVHCFGTEYPHTLAMCRVYPRKDRLLLGLQGLCALYAEAYQADLPERVVSSVTLRDWLKRDSLRRQQEKFFRRGRMEQEAIGMAGHVTGRTLWDRNYARFLNPSARYHEMNETLRPEFYGPVWQADRCAPRDIFLSQGDYPVKGLHYMLLAMPAILRAYPDARVYVAGNSLVEHRTLKQRLKISAYGRYLRSLLEEGGLWDRVMFLGRLDAGQMRDRYLASGLFVCCSSAENSPNSLGEAMLLGLPCVAAGVGGIPSIFAGDVDGILYEGFSGDRESGEGQAGTALEAVAGRLAEAVIRMWSDEGKREQYCKNARSHALRTHDRERNSQRLAEIYGKMV